MAEWQEKLRKLDKLLKDPLITDEEYDKEKALLMPSEMKKGLLDRLGEKKRILYVFGGFILISSALVRGCGSDENANSPEPMIVESVPDLTPVETPTATSVETPTATSVETPTATSVETSTTTSVPSETSEQQEATEWAKDYMNSPNFFPFSRSGLIDQLVFDGFTLEEATYGVDAQNADWASQAAQIAQEYLDDCCFSRSGLVDQLVFDGFTLEEATYGVDAQNADWGSQAAQIAQEYLAGFPFSRSELVDQLVFDGFTLQQATYGVSTAGL